jgi:hypothetical protein
MDRFFYFDYSQRLRLTRNGIYQENIREYGLMIVLPSFSSKKLALESALGFIMFVRD